MESRELIKRLILALLDQESQEPGEASPIPGTPELMPDVEPVDQNHFKQIADLTGDHRSPCEPANAPDEHYADIEAVTTHAGGGWQGPKHPVDIRADSVSMYPEFKGFKHYYDEIDNGKY
jgi:hypothetical protein